MKTSLKRKPADMRLIMLVIPVVMVLIIGFFILTGNVILNLSKDKFTFKSKNYADYINTWAERILSELSIYKDSLDKEGTMNEHSFDILSTSYGPHSEYPFGLYWGDEYRNFYDASGWDPGPEYIPASRDWYIEGREHTEFDFGSPYIDVRADLPCVSVTVKMDYDNTESVLAADIYFDYATSLVEKISEQEIDNAFFVSAVTRMIVADSDSTLTGKTLNGDIDNELYRNISDLLDNDFVGLTKVKGNEVYYVNINKIEGINWYFVTCMKESVMLANLHRVNVYILIISAAACVILIFLTHRASKEFIAADKEAKTDPLTRLLNRDGFDVAVRAALKNYPDQGIMLMFDIDNFKMVNDKLGHPVGDEFLKNFAAMLSEYFNRNRDISARLGGDEFVVMVGRKISREDVSTMLNKFIGLFHKNFDEKFAELGVSVSIGAVFVGTGGSNDLDGLYRSTDNALYKAKNEGKNCFVIA